MPLLYLEDQAGAFTVMTPERLAMQYLPGYDAANHVKTAPGPVLTPIVNHGKWVVQCPFCPSANRASRDDPRFLCCECANSGIGGDWLPVRYPDNAAEIERLLLARGDRHTRHWTPGETVAGLLAENIAHGAV